MADTRKVWGECPLPTSGWRSKKVRGMCKADDAYEWYDHNGQPRYNELRECAENTCYYSHVYTIWGSYVMVIISVLILLFCIFMGISGNGNGFYVGAFLALISVGYFGYKIYSLNSMAEQPVIDLETFHNEYLSAKRLKGLSDNDPSYTVNDYIRDQGFMQRGMMTGVQGMNSPIMQPPQQSSGMGLGTGLALGVGASLGNKMMSSYFGDNFVENVE